MAAEREHIRRTIELAEESIVAGNTPFGALLVVDGEVVRESQNTTVTDEDVSAHPELKLARWADRELDAAERADCTMYASTEPCAMCTTAIHYAGIGRVVFGVAGETLSELADGVVPIPASEVIRRAGGATTVEGPVATEAAMAVHESFYGGDDEDHGDDWGDGNDGDDEDHGDDWGDGNDGDDVDGGSDP